MAAPPRTCWARPPPRGAHTRSAPDPGQGQRDQRARRAGGRAGPGRQGRHRRCSAHAAGNRRAPRVGERRGLRHDDQGESTRPAGRGATRAVGPGRRVHRARTRTRPHRRAHRARRGGDRRGADQLPHAAQVFRVIRYVGGLDGQRRSKEVAYCVTSLTPPKPAPRTSPSCCATTGAPSRTRSTGRDTTFHEDASTLRTGTAPQAMAIIRNTLIAAFRLTEWNNLKQARRHFSHAINRCVDLITKPAKTVKHNGALHPPRSLPLTSANINHDRTSQEGPTSGGDVAETAITIC